MQKRPISSEEISEKDALQRAAALCSRSEQCVRQIEEKLESWGLSSEARNRIIDRLIEEKYIDEARFCRAYALDKMRYNHWGRLKIDQMLRLQGIAPAERKKALLELPEDEYEAVLKRLAQGKLPSIKACSAYERNGKLMRYLVGKGFEPTLVRKVLDFTDDAPDTF